MLNAKSMHISPKLSSPSKYLFLEERIYDPMIIYDSVKSNGKCPHTKKITIRFLQGMTYFLLFFYIPFLYVCVMMMGGIICEEFFQLNYNLLLF